MTRLTALLALALTGCAWTKLSDPRTGKTILFTHGDFAALDVTAPGISLHAQGVNHSGPTEAGGRAFSHGVNAVGGAASSAVLAAGSSGLFRAGVSTASRLVIPTAAVASNYAAKPPPKATPAPTAAQIWPDKTNP